MNKSQIAYKNAKSALDTANKIAEKKLAAYEYLLDSDSQDDCTKYSNICVQVETELNIVALIETLRAAELDMINWMIETVSKDEKYTKIHAQMTTEILANLHMLKIRKMVVNLAYSL